MKHRATPRFWRAYRELPREVRQLADRSYELLKRNSAHPSLHFKKVGQLWSARIGLHYRAMAVEAGGDRVWFWIGSHAEYDKLLAGRLTSVCTRRRRVDAARNRSGAAAAAETLT